MGGQVISKMTQKGVWRFTIAFLRSPNPSLHTPAFLDRCPSPSRSFTSLPSTPVSGDVGAQKPDALPETSMGALRRRKAPVKKADKTNCGSPDAAKEKAKARPTSAKAKIAGAKATMAEDASKETAAQNVATGPAEGPIVLAKFVSEDVNAVQDAAVDRVDDVAFDATENESRIKAKQELSEFVAKLDLSTFKYRRRWEETAYRLLDFGISSAHVMKMLPKCRSLCCCRSPDPILKHFTILSMSHEQMGRVISLYPYILNFSDSIMQSKTEFFESVGIDKRALGRIMHLMYRMIGLSLSTLKRRYDFWQEYFQDVHESNLRCLISKYPRIWTMDSQKAVKPKLAFLEELGLSKKMLLSHTSARGVLLGISILKLHAQLHYLLALGFSFDQVQKIVANCPHLFKHKEDYISLRLSYAVNVMKLSFDTLNACPRFWESSYKNRIKYRYEVLQELKALGAYKRKCSVGYMVSMTDADFARKFVKKLQAYTKHSNI